MKAKLYLSFLIAILCLAVYLHADIQHHWANPKYTMVYISFIGKPTPEEIRQAKLEYLQKQVSKHLTWYGFPTTFIDIEAINAEYESLIRKR